MEFGSLNRSWKRTRLHLRSAFELLPSTPVAGEDGSAVPQYQDWLDHNELELALDELEAIGETNTVPVAFWQSLLAAAEEMKLDDHVDRYSKRLRG